MNKEAMKLALEALKHLQPTALTSFYTIGDRDKAITALREALAEQPAQQEPVVHRDGFWCADLTCKKCYSADFRFKHKNPVVNEFLTTPAQRTWVGLTKAEVDSWELPNHPTVFEFAQFVESKLKEKNT